MKRRVILATIVMATLLAGVLGAATLAGVKGVSAGSSTLEYKFLMPRPLIDEITDPLNTCTRSDNPTGDAEPFLNCPAGATAGNGDVVDINGSGTLSVHSKTATGSGRFTHHFAGGGSMSGTWDATELLSFKTYGDSPFLFGDPPTLQPTWRTGMARIRVHLVSDDGTIEADAILSLGCILPEVKMPGGVFEGVRLNVQGGENFNKQADPRGTLFILTSGDDGF